MNQNVFGVILFSLIVGTAIFVSEFFVTLPTPQTVYETPKYESRTRCHKETTSRGLANVKVVQAVLNQNTNQLETEYLIARENYQTETIGIALHFFVKDGITTRYLATQTMTLTPDFEYDGNANHSVISSYQWLDDLKRRDNLYVIAETSANFNQSKSLVPKFDETKATPVLLMKEKK